MKVIEIVDEAFGAYAIAGHLGMNVSDYLFGSPDIGRDKVEKVFVWLPLEEQLGHRNPQAFLKDLSGICGQASPADVESVASVSEEPDDASVFKDRDDHRQVIELPR